MKNPFVQMALIAAAMVAAFRENAYRNAGLDVPGSSRSRGAVGKRNPTGSKFLRRAYKAKHGARGSYDEALAWYGNYQ